MTQAIVNTRKDIFVENCWCNRFHRCRYRVVFRLICVILFKWNEVKYFAHFDSFGLRIFLSMMWLCIYSAFKYFCHISFDYLCTVITSEFSENYPWFGSDFTFWLSKNYTTAVDRHIDCRPADIFPTRFNT